MRIKELAQCFELAHKCHVGRYTCMHVAILKYHNTTPGDFNPLNTTVPTYHWWRCKRYP